METKEAIEIINATLTLWKMTLPQNDDIPTIFFNDFKGAINEIIKKNEELEKENGILKLNKTLEAKND